MPTSIAGAAAPAALTVTTAWTSLVTDTSNKNYIAVLDLKNATGTDTFSARLLIKLVNSGTTAQVVALGNWRGAQAVPMKPSIPIAAHISIEFQVRQTEGTGRSVPWELLSVS